MALSAHSVRVVQDKELPLLPHLLILLGRVRGVEDQVLEWGGGGSPQPHPDGGPARTEAGEAGLSGQAEVPVPAVEGSSAGELVPASSYSLSYNIIIYKNIAK